MKEQKQELLKRKLFLLKLKFFAPIIFSTFFLYQELENVVQPEENQILNYQDFDVSILDLTLCFSSFLLNGLPIIVVTPLYLEERKKVLARKKIT